MVSEYFLLYIFNNYFEFYNEYITFKLVNTFFNKNVKVSKLNLNITNMYVNESAIKDVIYLECFYSCFKLSNKYTNLVFLDCSGTDTDFIPIELSKLKYLDCSDTKLSNLPTEFINLNFLACSHTKLTKIPDEYVNLIYLNCSFNEYLKRIPKSLNKLKYLNLSYTKIINENEIFRKYNIDIVKYYDCNIISNMKNYYSSFCQGKLSG